MFQEKIKTAQQAAQKYDELMKRNSDLWARNIVECTENLTDEDQQLLFLKYLSDPQNKTGLRDKPIKTVPLRDTCIFDNKDLYEVTSVENGRVPLIKLRYKPSFQSQDDEKFY